jgi:N-acetyltransferase
MNYLEPVTLEGQHIRLEPLQPELHAEPMFLHFEPSVTQYLSRGGKPIENAKDLAVHLQELNAIPKRLNWAVRLLESGAVAGRISYSDTNQKDRWIEVGTMLMPAFWGGYANPEGKLLLLTRAFEVLGANRVQFKVDSRNQRSQGSMEKIGAVREGVLRQYQIRPDGFVRDSVVYSILASEWAEVRQKLEARL